MRDYFNTTELSGEELKEKKIKAGTQSDKILKYFRKIKLPMTPSDVHMNLFDESTPITSIRRSISTLTNKHGLLSKTNDQKIGPYGSNEYFWELK